MKDSGRMTCSMAKDSKDGKMVQVTWDHTSMVKSKGLVFTVGMMGQSMEVSGTKTESMAL